MTDAALADFRRSATAGPSAPTCAMPRRNKGRSIGKETTELDPVIALVFGQSGLIAGATLSGVKYTRIIP